MKDTTAIQRLELWCKLEEDEAYRDELVADIRALIKVAEAAKNAIKNEGWYSENVSEALRGVE